MNKNFDFLRFREGRYGLFARVLLWVALSLFSFGAAADWAKSFGGSGSNVDVAGTALDSAGNVYVAGTFSGTVDFGGTSLSALGFRDAFAAKMDSTGTFLWAKSFGGNGVMIPRAAFAVDSAGDTYLGGSFSGGSLTDPNSSFTLALSGQRDAFMLKLDKDGTLQWEKNFGGGQDSVFATSVVLHEASGKVYLGGGVMIVGPGITWGSSVLASIGGSGGSDVYALQLDSGTGAALWAKNFGSQAGVGSLGAMAVDGAGNLYLGGEFSGDTLTDGSFYLGPLGTTDAFAVKLSSAGAVAWAKNFGGSWVSASIKALATDSSGNAYLGGEFSGGSLTDAFAGFSLAPLGTKDAFVLQLSGSGAVAWAKSFGGAGVSASGKALATDGAGNPYLGGEFSGGSLTDAAAGFSLAPIGSVTDAFALELNTAGVVAGAKNFGGNTASGTSIAADSVGNVYLGGNFSQDNLTTPALTLVSTLGDGFVVKAFTASVGGGGSGGSGSDVGGSGNGVALLSSGGSANVGSQWGLIQVADDGQTGSTISMAEGTQTYVLLPGNGSVGVESASGSMLKVNTVEINGKTVQVLEVAEGSATATSSRDGQATISAGNVTVVAEQGGSTRTASVDAKGRGHVRAKDGDTLIVDKKAAAEAASVELGWGSRVRVQSAKSKPVQVTAVPEPASTASYSVPKPVQVSFDDIDMENGRAVTSITLGTGQIELSEPAYGPALGVNGRSLVVCSASSLGAVQSCPSSIAAYIYTELTDFSPWSIGEVIASVPPGRGNGFFDIFNLSEGFDLTLKRANRSAAEGTHFYPGESAEFNIDGGLKKIRLGSLHRDQAWVGDPLGLADFGGGIVRARIAKIEGMAPRLDRALPTAILDTLGQSTGESWSGQSQDLSTGVWRLQARNAAGIGRKLAVWPVGEIVADQGPDLVRAAGNGMAQVRTGGLLATLTPAMVDPEGFTVAMKASGAHEVMFQPDGTLHVVFDGGKKMYVYQPDWDVQSGQVQGFDVDNLGKVRWTDSQGNAQTLNPAFADLSHLLDVLRADDPGLIFQYAWRGEVRIVLNGTPMLLQPDNFMVPTPSAHRQDAWWVEDGKAYVRYPSYQYGGITDFTQGFTMVQL